MSNLKLDVQTADGTTNGTVDLPASIFDVEVSVPLMHQVVVAQLAAKRQGTHATKTRGEVRGGGRKPFRQKGTGRARQGSIRAPHFTGGGTVHGPQPRDYDQRTPKKMKAAALRAPSPTGSGTTGSTSSRSSSPARPLDEGRPDLHRAPDRPQVRSAGPRSRGRHRLEVREQPAERAHPRQRPAQHLRRPER